MRSWLRAAREVAEGSDVTQKGRCEDPLGLVSRDQAVFDKQAVIARLVQLR